MPIVPDAGWRRSESLDDRCERYYQYDRKWTDLPAVRVLDCTRSQSRVRYHFSSSMELATTAHWLRLSSGFQSDV
jgi:hypothetical protein